MVSAPAVWGLLFQSCYCPHTGSGYTPPEGLTPLPCALVSEPTNLPIPGLCSSYGQGDRPVVSLLPFHLHVFPPHETRGSRRDPHPLTVVLDDGVGVMLGSQPSV